MFMPYKVITGLILLIIGAVVAFVSLNYGLGSMVDMGAGMYPFLLGVCLAISGLFVALLPSSQYELSHDAIDAQLKRKAFIGRIRPWVCVMAGFLLFIIMRRYGGFLPASFALVFVSLYAESDIRFIHRVYYSAGVTAVAVIIFVFLMQMQFPLFTWG